MTSRAHLASLRHAGRIVLAYAGLFLIWLPLRGHFVALLAYASEKTFWLFSTPAIASGLSAEGEKVLVYTCLSGVARPLAAWNARNIHMSLLLGVAIAIASPGRGVTTRFRLASLSAAALFILTLGSTVVQVAQVSIAAGFQEFGLRTCSEGLLSALRLAGQVLFAGALLVPMALFFCFHGSLLLRPRPPDAPGSKRHVMRGSRSPGLPRGSWVCALVLLFASGAAVLGMAREPTASDYLAALRQVREANPDSPQTYLSLGVYDEEAGRLDDADRNYRESLKRDPRLTAARFGLGNVLFKAGQVLEAEEAYRAVLLLDPDHVSALENLGIALEGRGEYGEAAKCFSQVIGKEPTHAAAHHNLGVVLMKLGRSCDALPELQRGFHLDRRFATDPSVAAAIKKLRSTCPSSASR